MFSRRKKRRPIFGFPCTPLISYNIRAIAQTVGLPIYCLGEHALQAGITLISTQLEDEKAAESLKEHLIGEHLLVNKVDPGNEFDEVEMEEIRKKHGMAAYALLNIPKIDKLLEKGNVVIDGLYSWEAYLELKKKYGESFICIAVYASPETRYNRLENRKYDPKNDKEMRHRPSTREQAQSRDYAEIGNLHKAGPIAMADFTIINKGNLEDLQKEVDIGLEKITG